MVIKTEPNTNNSSDLNTLFTTVVAGGYCIGCGACAVVTGSPVKMKLDRFKRLQATVPNGVDLNQFSENYQRICPFSNSSQNENEIAKQLYATNNMSNFNDKIGFYLNVYAGHVVESDYREAGSSGGMASWVAHTLFDSGLVDGVIHIHRKAHTKEDPRIFHFQLSLSKTEIREGSKSRYYPVEMSEVLTRIKVLPGRYALIGVPCFIKAVRLLMKQDAVLENRIPFCIGLVCGHLKSARYAEMLSWQLGIKPSELRDIDFRSKLPGLKSNEYGVTVEGIIGGKSVKKAGKPVNRLYGTNWGYGYFKYKACDYCDDVVAETADISIGDAWIPEYMNDDKGTNLVIIRNPILNDLIQAAIHKKTIAMTAIRVQDAIQSQNAGFEDRRTGLAYRLYLDELKGDWHPAKRVNARHADIPAKIKKKAESRIQLAEQSHIAFQYAVDLNSFDLFKKKMKPLLNSYNKLYPSPLWPRIWSRLKLIYQQLAK